MAGKKQALEELNSQAQALKEQYNNSNPHWQQIHAAINYVHKETTKKLKSRKKKYNAAVYVNRAVLFKETMQAILDNTDFTKKRNLREKTYNSFKEQIEQKTSITFTEQENSIAKELLEILHKKHPQYMQQSSRLVKYILQEKVLNAKRTGNNPDRAKKQHIDRDLRKNFILLGKHIAENHLQAIQQATNPSAKNKISEQIYKQFKKNVGAIAKQKKQHQQQAQRQQQRIEKHKEDLKRHQEERSQIAKNPADRNNNRRMIKLNKKIKKSEKQINKDIDKSNVIHVKGIAIKDAEHAIKCEVTGESRFKKFNAIMQNKTLAEAQQHFQGLNFKALQEYVTSAQAKVDFFGTPDDNSNNISDTQQIAMIQVLIVLDCALKNPDTARQPKKYIARLHSSYQKLINKIFEEPLNVTFAGFSLLDTDEQQQLLIEGAQIVPKDNKAIVEFNDKVWDKVYIELTKQAKNNFKKNTSKKLYENLILPENSELYNGLLDNYIMLERYRLISKRLKIFIKNNPNNVNVIEKEADLIEIKNRVKTIKEQIKNDNKFASELLIKRADNTKINKEQMALYLSKFKINIKQHGAIQLEKVMQNLIDKVGVKIIEKTDDLNLPINLDKTLDFNLKLAKQASKNMSEKLKHNLTYYDNAEIAKRVSAKNYKTISNFDKTFATTNGEITAAISRTAIAQKTMLATKKEPLLIRIINWLKAHNMQNLATISDAIFAPFINNKTVGKRALKKLDHLRKQCEKFQNKNTNLKSNNKQTITQCYNLVTKQLKEIEHNLAELDKIPKRKEEYKIMVEQSLNEMAQAEKIRDLLREINKAPNKKVMLAKISSYLNSSFSSYYKPNITNTMENINSLQRQDFSAHLAKRKQNRTKVLKHRSRKMMFQHSPKSYRENQIITQEENNLKQTCDLLEQMKNLKARLK